MQGFGDGANIRTGGELTALDFIRSAIGEGATVIDVGANRGQYALQVLQALPKATIHCLEPQAVAFHACCTALSNESRATVHNVALSTSSCTQTIYSNSPGSELASLRKRRLDHFGIEVAHREEVKAWLLSDFLVANNIESVDLLKLDIEGTEYEVLLAARDLVLSGRIKTIQFEFGGANIDSRTFFQDFFYFLKPSFTLFRLCSSRLLQVDSYEELDEVFVTTNYLAVHNSVA